MIEKKTVHMENTKKYATFLISPGISQRKTVISNSQNFSVHTNSKP